LGIGWFASSTGCSWERSQAETSGRKKKVLEVIGRGVASCQEVVEYVAQKWGIEISPQSIRTFLHANGFRWKRKRKWPSNNRDETLIEFFQGEMKALQTLEDQGEIDLLYYDEAGFSLQSNVPYGWQQVGKTERIPASQGGHVTVMGFINRKSEGKFQLMEKAPKADDILTFFDQLANDIKRKTILVLDKASIHTAGIIKEKIDQWKKKGLFLQYLPTAAPELNLIEILWRIIKYKWLTPDSYKSKNDLVSDLDTILANIGSEYRVNYQ